MKLVVLDGYTLNPGDLDWSSMESLGETKIYDRTSENEIFDRIQDADIVLTNKTPLRKELIERCNRLRLISVLATGYDVVDVDAASKKGIVVCNVPSYGTYSVSQFAIALLLEICCQVGHHSQMVFQGKWTKNKDWCFWDSPLTELYQKTMGIIGYGRIGQRTGEIAKALGMHVIAYDKYPCKENIEYVDLDELCKNSDVIVLHCSLNAQTYHLINKERLKAMKKSAILINNSGGSLIDEIALAEALNNGIIKAAGLDVVSLEPIQKNNPLLHTKNCFITPHMSWGSYEARKRILNSTVKNITSFIAGHPVNQIND